MSRHRWAAALSLTDNEIQRAIIVNVDHSDGRTGAK